MFIIKKAQVSKLTVIISRQLRTIIIISKNTQNKLQCFKVKQLNDASLAGEGKWLLAT